MSESLINAGRQTLLLELQEASRLPERLGEDFVRAAETVLNCNGKVIVSGIGKSGHIGKKSLLRLPALARLPFSCTRQKRCTAISVWLKAATLCCLSPIPARQKSWS